MAAKKKKPTDYNALTTKEAKAKAIAAAKTPTELDAMWAAWEGRGLSRDGLTYAAVLQRQRELGADLPEGDIERIERAAKRQKEGSALPPITGAVKKEVK